MVWHTGRNFSDKAALRRSARRLLLVPAKTNRSVKTHFKDFQPSAIVIMVACKNTQIPTLYDQWLADHRMGLWAVHLHATTLRSRHASDLPCAIDHSSSLLDWTLQHRFGRQPPSPALRALLRSQLTSMLMTVVSASFCLLRL